jgi:uncharacterized protein (TIGR02594 family)
MTALQSLRADAGAVARTTQAEFNKWADAHAPWLKFAYSQLGVQEVRGRGRDNSNKAVNAYLQSCWNTCANYPDIDLHDDATPWCSAFVNWCLLRAGIKGTGSTWSRSWLTWQGGMKLGPDLSRAPVGAIVIMSRGDSKKEQGHVAFLWSMAGGKPYYLGGNQGNGTVANRRSNQVSISHYPNEVLECIWPLRSIGPIPRAWSEGRYA